MLLLTETQQQQQSLFASFYHDVVDAVSSFWQDRVMIPSAAASSSSLTSIFTFIPSCSWEELSSSMSSMIASFTFTTFHYNVLVAFLQILHYKFCLELVSRICFVNKGERGSNDLTNDRDMDGSRPGAPSFLHTIVSQYTKPILQACLMSQIFLVWPLYDTTDWSYRLNVVVPTAMAARFFYKGAIRKDPDDVEIQLMTRSSQYAASSPSELLFGPFQSAVILIWLGLYRFMHEEAALIGAALGIGDGLLAPIIGEWYGRHHYANVFGKRKTMEGSLLGVFLGTVIGTYIYLVPMVHLQQMHYFGSGGTTGAVAVVGVDNNNEFDDAHGGSNNDTAPQPTTATAISPAVELIPLRIILAYGLIAAVIEGLTPGGIDNVAIAVAIHFSVDKINQYMVDGDTTTVAAAAVAG